MAKVTAHGGPSVAGETPPRLSVLQLRRLLRLAQPANEAYLAVEAPTAAQTREQVRALTEQVDALSRLMLGA